MNLKDLVKDQRELIQDDLTCLLDSIPDYQEAQRITLSS